MITATVSRVGRFTWEIKVGEDIWYYLYWSTTERLAERIVKRIVKRMERRRNWRTEERQVYP